MGMSTHVYGFKPPDDRWRQMKVVWDACSDAGVKIPDSVDRFFDGEEPDPGGVEVEIEETPAVREWSDETREGFEVILSELPPDVTVIRFYNSW